MLNDEGMKRDDLVNQIHAAGSKFNKSMHVGALKTEALKIKEFCEELLRMIGGR